ncbi:hypothetical protein, partial [Bacillus pumilus]|uniref:hypothetical protein n=1 Tax=Bacillus pumilus TaxID=1408 RepID=UPI001C92F13C
FTPSNHSPELKYQPSTKTYSFIPTTFKTTSNTKPISSSKINPPSTTLYFTQTHTNPPTQTLNSKTKSQTHQPFNNNPSSLKTQITLTSHSPPTHSKPKTKHFTTTHKTPHPKTSPSSQTSQ